MLVVWAPAALREIAAIYNYIAMFNPGAARDMAEALLEAGDNLANFPRRGRQVGSSLRETVVVYPYIIRYRIVDNQVRILRVRHGSRQS